MQYKGCQLQISRISYPNRCTEEKVNNAEALLIPL